MFENNIYYRMLLNMMIQTKKLEIIDGLNNNGSVTNMQYKKMKLLTILLK